MSDREKLIELIGSTEYGSGSLVGKNFQSGFIGKIADHLIANGVTVQRWIPVDVLLPDAGIDVLTYSNNPDAEKGEDYSPYYVGFRDSGYWYSTYEIYEDCTFMELHYVTHWMPLPEPPKDGEV